MPIMPMEEAPFKERDPFEALSAKRANKGFKKIR